MHSQGQQAASEQLAVNKGVQQSRGSAGVPHPAGVSRARQAASWRSSQRASVADLMRSATRSAQVNRSPVMYPHSPVQNPLKKAHGANRVQSQDIAARCMATGTHEGNLFPQNKLYISR